MENVFSFEISDVKASVILPKKYSNVGSGTDPISALAQLKMIHRHSAYELFYVPKGRLTVFTVGGSEVYENSLVIVPPSLDHYATHESDQRGYDCLYFDVEKNNREADLLDLLVQKLDRGVTALPISEDENFYFEHLIGEPVDKEGVGHLLYLLFSEIFRRLVPPCDSRRSSDWKRDKHITAIDLYISAHYTENVDLTDLSQELYLCTKQVARIIRREYGCSLSELVNQRRLAAACMLLKYTALDIKEVAAQVGYEYENYFYTRFRRQYGITPKQFRNGESGRTP